VAISNVVEDLRSGRTDADALGRAMHIAMERMYPICRSLAGDGVRATLDRVCCVGRSGGMVERTLGGSEGGHQFIERNSNSMVD